DQPVLGLLSRAAASGYFGSWAVAWPAFILTLRGLIFAFSAALSGEAVTVISLRTNVPSGLWPGPDFGKLLSARASSRRALIFRCIVKASKMCVSFFCPFATVFVSRSGLSHTGAALSLFAAQKDCRNFGSVAFSNSSRAFKSGA